MDVRDVVASLRSGWWMPVLGLILGGAAALAFSLLSPKLYSSSAQLFVSTTGSQSTSDVFQGSQFSRERVTSYAKLLSGDQLARTVADRLGLHKTPEQLTSEISVAAVPDTVLLDITVTDPSPAQAQQIAVTLTDEFRGLVRQLETSDARGAISPVKVTVTEAPQLPRLPSSPRTVRNLALGLLAGLALGAGLAVLRTRLDRSVTEGREAAELGRAPVIGTVLRDEALEKRHTIDRGAGSRTAEDYRQLRTNLQFLSVDEPPKVIMVSSAVPSEGKTTVVINLALALADAGRRVVIVEADLRRPKVTRYLGMVGDVGLTHVLTDAAELGEVVQEYRERVWVIASGPTPPNPGELLASSHMSALLEKLRAENDYVLIDAPPLLPVADASSLAPSTDGVLLSVRHGRTHKDQLRQASATLERVGAKTLGVILNIVPPKAQGASAYGYGNGHGYGYG